jgi:multimeric flavodoxin WrbA
MKVVAIVGSPRPKGNTNYLVDQALEEISKHDIETEKIILSQYRINGCLGHENCRSFKVCQQDDDGRWIVQKFSQADGIILATPVYYYNMTAQMKAFIDRNYFLYMHGIRLNAVCAGLIVVAGGSAIDITVRALRRCFRVKGENWEERIFTLTGYASRPGEVKNQPALIEEAQNLGRKMADILEATKGSKTT